MTNEISARFIRAGKNTSGSNRMASGASEQMADSFDPGERADLVLV